MNEKQAWLFIADQYNKYSACRQKTLYSAFGVCAAIDRMRIEGYISQSTCEDMHERINIYRAVQQIVSVYFWPCKVEYALDRVELCETFASQL